jgi:dCTP deaminase
MPISFQSGRRRRPFRSSDVVLADHEITAAQKKGTLRVEPFDQDMVRPAALSFRLGRRAYVLKADGAVDTALSDSYPSLEPRPLDERGRLVVQPGEVVLAPTLERVTLPETLVGVLDGISDVARLGMSVVLAQQVSPGFGAPDGAVLTLEIVSRLSSPIYLWPGTRICNLMLMRCARPLRSYSARSNNHSSDVEAMPSRLAGYIAAGLPRHTGETVAVVEPGP